LTLTLLRYSLNKNLAIIYWSQQLKTQNALLALVIFFSTSFLSAAENTPRTIVHLLDYLGRDYGGAVENGNIISQGEYNEQVEFVNVIVTAGNAIPEISSNKKINGDIQKLQKLIMAKGQATQVAALTNTIKNEVINITKLEVAPTQWPNLARGRELFAQNCVTCHGITGAGDGPAGVGLDPKPSNFLDNEHMSEISPFQAFNTIRLGVEGTGMAPFAHFTERDIWSLAFYVVSLRHEQSHGTKISTEEIHKTKNEVLSKITLAQAATSSDNQLRVNLSGSEEEKSVSVAQVRLNSGGDDAGSSLNLAKEHLDSALHDYKNGDHTSAKNKALLAYLEGVEPIEPRLKASDPAAIILLEEKMSAVRVAIESKKSLVELQLAVGSAKEQILVAETIISQKASSPTVTFLVASAIILREGFEAVLILIALLGVVRAAGSKKAAHWIHAGWITALLLGVVAWIFSGWVMGISGAQRELLEGGISILAVVILLYMGFWLHSRTEIGRWKEFISGRVNAMLEGGNLFGLAAISFIAVFREVFETVLFLRALWLEGGAGIKTAMFSGVAVSFVLLIILSWSLIKYSARLPIKKIFTYSSSLMAVLAVILVGKGVHAFQETGMISITSSPIKMRFDLFGFYPTIETTVAQICILTLTILLWMYGNRPSTKH